MRFLHIYDQEPSKLIPAEELVPAASHMGRGDTHPLFATSPRPAHFSSRRKSYAVNSKVVT